LSTLPGFSLTDTLSLGGFTTSTQFIFNVSNVVNPNSGIITHDDGMLLQSNSPGNPNRSPLSDAAPTAAENTTYALLAADVGFGANLYYVAANNLPEVLISPNFSGVPLPATAWLFGGGLGGLIMLARRRRRAIAA